MKDYHPDTLIQGVRIVPVGGVPAPDGPVDIRISGGRITEVGPSLAPSPDEQVHDGSGRWAIPGLWDHHVHMQLWATTLIRVNLMGTESPAEAVERVRAHIESLPEDDPTSLVIGFGHRSAMWTRSATVAELDEVSGEHPVILISGDGHNGWLNTAALELMGAPTTLGPLTETDWFPVFSQVDSLPGLAEANAQAYRAAVLEASARGVVGIGDMEFGAAHLDWPARFDAGVDTLRVRGAVYPDGVEAVIEAGLSSGDELGDSSGLLRMGPLKIIGDGSLNTRSAYCVEPYVDSPEGSRGEPNIDAGRMEELFARATEKGLEIAVHAIGDAAVGQSLDCFEATGARGSIEHAQLVALDALDRMARLGVAASVQPAHLLDDRDVSMACWPDRADRCFMLRGLLDAGVELRMGSDAPVSPLDPWLTMASAVHRTADDREPWHPEQALTPAEALAASTDGETTLAVGGRGDVVLLESDPLTCEVADLTDATATAAAAEALRAMKVAATFVSGRATYVA